MILIPKRVDGAMGWKVPSPVDGAWVTLRSLGLYATETMAVTAMEKHIRTALTIPPPEDTVAVVIETPAFEYEIGKTHNRLRTGLPTFRLPCL